MDKNQQTLIKLLSAAIRGREITELDFDGVDWRALYEEAKAHEVYTLIYPAISNLAHKIATDSTLLAEWQRAVLYSGMTQIQHIEQMSRVLSSFNNAGIPVIALKGLVLRDLYPQPELRTMSDADILVKRKDIDRSKNLLLKMGYHIHGEDIKHIHFKHQSYPPIELHQSLVDYNKFKNSGFLEDTLWKNAVAAALCSIPAFSLSLGDQVLHLFLHMASHFKSCGFGLRPLCDLVLMIERNRESINWNYFAEKAELCGLFNFASTILLVCKKLFGLEIPEVIYNPNLENEPFVEAIISDIFAGGAYGDKDSDRLISGLRLHFSKHAGSKSPGGRLENFLSLVFPPVIKLGTRYSYAKKHSFLLPAAWIHRAVWFLIRRDVNGYQKKNSVLPSSRIKAIGEERTKLLDWLQLQ